MTVYSVDITPLIMVMIELVTAYFVDDICAATKLESLL